MVNLSLLMTHCVTAEEIYYFKAQAFG